LSALRSLAVAAAGIAVVSMAGPAMASSHTTAACHKNCTTTGDTVAPTLSIASPAAGSSVQGTVTVAGSASDNTAVATVAVAVDGGAWQTASGTTSWSWAWSTNGVANGSHTVVAKATDTSGNASTSSVTVTVANTTATTTDTTPPSVTISSPGAGATVSGTVAVTGTAADNGTLSAVAVSVDGGTWSTASGTSNWSWNWATTGLTDGGHTLSVRATDASGNASQASRTVTVSNTAPSPSPSPSSSPSSSAPDTQGTWVSPEGVHLSVSTAGSWTLSSVYALLKANALDLDKIGPSLTVNVQDAQSTYTTTSAGMTSGRYTTYVATMWLQGTSTAFTTMPNATLAHEYGHAWSQYQYYITHQGSWAGYLSARWTTSDGSLTLATDSRTNSSYTWTVNEIVADDYRLLLASSAAASEKPTHLNTTIPAPASVPGLSTYLAGAFRSA